MMKEHSGKLGNGKGFHTKTQREIRGGEERIISHTKAQRPWGKAGDSPHDGTGEEEGRRRKKKRKGKALKNRHLCRFLALENNKIFVFFKKTVIHYIARV